MHEAFEQAILEQPDDVATYAAYADWLMEQGDPRGEFMQVQLALEDEKRSPTERAALAERERELLALHERNWLGSLAPYFLGPKTTARGMAAHRWRRGILWSVTAHCLTMRSAQALAIEPATRLLQELHIQGEARYFSIREGSVPPRVSLPHRGSHHWELLELIGAPCFRSLRRFQMGDPDEPAEDRRADCHTYALGLEHLFEGLEGIEELHLLCKGYDIVRLFSRSNLTRLRVLRLYHYGRYGNEERYAYPLDVLAANPAFKNLTHLLFHPHQTEQFEMVPSAGGGYQTTSARSFIPLEQVQALLASPHLGSLTHLQLRLSDMGDAGVRAIIASGWLKRLKSLDLRHGCITDTGARLLAACPDARRLEMLDLSRNAVTAAGLETLDNAGLMALANEPLTQPEIDGYEYLFEGDSE